MKCEHEWFLEKQETEYTLLCICKNCGNEHYFDWRE